MLKLFTRLTMLLVLLALLFVISVSYDTKATDAGGLMLISKKLEIQIGRESCDQALAELGGQTNDLEAANALDIMGQGLVKQCKRQDITYTFYIAKSGMINAFACPGGFIIITEGIMKHLKSKDELAFVVAHEIAHVAAQHGRKELNKSLLSAVGMRILLKDAPIETKNLTNVAMLLINRGHSRNDEYQADELGTEYLQSAGYNKNASLTALASLGLSKLVGEEKYLATHPDTPNRIDRIAKKLGYTHKEAVSIVGKPFN